VSSQALRELLVGQLTRSGAIAAGASEESVHLWARNELARELAGDRSSLSVHLIAALLVTYGDASLLELVVNTTPKVEGNTGGMVAFGSNVLSAVLPLPPQLQRHGRQVVDVRAVKAWLAEHQPRLRWNGDSGAFELA
jgi:hypothetical protein